MKIYSYRRIFQAGLLILLACVVLFGLFWVNREYRHHVQAMQQVHDDYVALRKAEVRTIVNQLIQTIEFHKDGVEDRLKKSIVEKVRMGVDIARAIHESEQGLRDEAEIKQLIIDALMPLRFFDGRGYYWIHDVNHVLVAHPFRRSSLGRDDSMLIDSQGRFLIQDFVRAALDNLEGGFVIYYWSRPDVDERYHLVQGSEKIAYLQLFEPFNWVIGVGEYLDDAEARTQEEMIRRVAAVRFGEAGYIFNHDRRGFCLNHVNEEVIGQDRWELLDATGMKLVQELDRVGRQPGGGFLEYVATFDPRTGEPAKKLSFVRSVDDWDWVLGAGVYLEDIDAWLAEMHADMVQQMRGKLFTLLAGLGVVAALVLLAMHRLMGRFARELDYIVSARAADEAGPLDLDRFRIAELREIAVKSNAVLEQKVRAQEQLNQAQKMETVGVLAGGVAHDFNNLLQVMAGNIQLLLMNRPGDGPEAKRLKTVAQTIDRAARLVRQLLLLSRKADIVRQPVDLNREIEEAARLLERTIPRMVGIELRLEDGLWMIHADPVQVEQVLLNLGTNAADAMPDGGRLIVETSNIVLDTAFAQTHLEAKSGPHVLLSVTDTGCGMDRQTLARMFDPFFTTKEVGRGTGLGLASVYGIVKGHGGYISCYSLPGQGTTFRIYWPTQSAAGQGVEPVLSTGHAAEPQAQAAPGRGETILVVDDEDDIRELTAEALESHGYKTLTAADGEQALALYADKGQDIALVILDLGMPGMGGRQFLRELLRLAPQARTLVASGYAGGSLADEVLRDGAIGFIGKPFQLTELLARVREALDG